ALAGAVERARCDPGDADGSPGAPCDLLLVAKKHVEHALADGAEAEQSDLQCFHRSTPSSRNICLIPLIACLVRASFSIIAKRTWPSPNSPKPMPGETDTFALANNRFANSREPSFS